MKLLKLSKRICNNTSVCLLCPHRCVISEGNNGFCNIRTNIGGEIVVRKDIDVSVMAIEPIEKKPLKHFLPGTKTLSFGGTGCNLRCSYCENYEISQKPKSKKSYATRPFSSKEIVKWALIKNCDSVCMTYNEPIIFFENMMDIAQECHKHGLKFIIKTNAYVNLEPWQEICKVVDAMNIDVKGDDILFDSITKCEYKNIYYKILWAFINKVHVELSIPIYSNHCLSDFLNRFGSQMKSIKVDVPCHLLKVYPANLMIDCDQTSEEEISSAKNILDQYFSKVYV